MRKGQTGAIIGIGAIVVVFIVFLILMLGYDTVDASHIGVKNRFGVIEGTMSPGMQWTGLFTSVYQYDLRLRSMTVNMDQTSSAVDKDGQSVFATIQVNYRLNPDNVQIAYSRIGQDHELAEILNIDGTVKEGFKTTTSGYSSLEIFQKREEVKQKAIKQISDNFPSEYFILDNVIISNIDYNPEFKEAIELKKVNEERAKAKEKEVDYAKFEADRKIEEARGEAESQALRTLKLAEAEAKALELKRQQLTPLMVQNNWIDRWDGKLPQYVLGENTNLLMQMPE